MPDHASYDEFIAAKSQLGGMHGFAPNWLPDFLFDFQKALVDWATRKGRCAIFADCGLGKGQPEGALILTPTGFVANTELMTGDKVIGSDGLTYALLDKYERGEQLLYRIHLSDRSSFVVDHDHLHIVRTNNDRQRGRPWRVLSTAQLLQLPLRYGSGGKSRNYDIPLVAPVQWPSVAHWIHPYVLGVLLGDGCITARCMVTIADEHILATLSGLLPSGWTLQKRRHHKYDYFISKNKANDRSFIRELRRLNILGTRSGTKSIPPSYLFDSVEHRVWLLRGLMDTDGYIKESSQFYSTSSRLADDVLFLVRSLGGAPTRSIKAASCMHKGTRRMGAPCHVLTFSLTTFNPFHLARKAIRWNSTPRDNGRWIDRIEAVGVGRTICLRVDSPDQSYVTEAFIVTHNTPVQLVWAENIVRQTNGRVLVVTPLAVSQQTIREGAKFGIQCERSSDGRSRPNITVTNYERLHHFNPDDFIGVVCDESSAIKHFEGERQKIVTAFMRKIPYRLLCTATAAPNDYIELGTSAEALGEMGRMDMLGTFFKNDENSLHPIWWGARWRFKAHAEKMFWRWVCSWARAMRRPSDMGFDDGRFVLPPLTVAETVIANHAAFRGELFPVQAVTLQEQREERRITLPDRCADVATKVNGHAPAVVWCHLNEEADLLERIIPGSKQVQGSNSDEEKEETFTAFSSGQLRVLITKPKIGAFGLNWQHCAHMTFFPSHSFEQYYQGVRRCWRFGQTRPVRVDIVTTQGELGVLQNLQRKSAAAAKMFDQLVEEMNHALKIERTNDHVKSTQLPSWL